MLRRLLTPLALAAVAAASGCLHGASSLPHPVPHPPSPTPGPAPPSAEIRGTLSIAALTPAGAAADKNPLAVVFGGPSGETTQATEITLVFNKPMRKLGPSSQEALPPVTLTPPVPGRWDWVGSKALRFSAAAKIPGASSFRVEVPKGTRALDGSALPEAYTLTFSTPRPTLERSDPEAGADHVPPKQQIELSFSQPVSDAEVLRAVSLAVRGTTASLPFSVRHDPEVKDPRRVELTPRSPLPRSASVIVRVDPSLRGEEGPLPMGKAAEVSFRTIDPPRALAVGCETLAPEPEPTADSEESYPPTPRPLGACSPDDPITVRFNNSIHGPTLGSIISTEPAVKLDFSDQPQWAVNEIALVGDFLPGKTYRVHVRPSAADKPVLDEHEQPLIGDFQQTIRIGDRRPELGFSGSGVYWMPKGPRALPVVATNVNSITLTARPLSREQVIAALESGKDPAPAPPAVKRFSMPTPPHNETTSTRFRLDELLRTPEPHGPVLFQASYRVGQKARSLARELQLTDLGVNAKLSPDQATLWVTRFTTGAPVDKAEVAIHRLNDRSKPPVNGVTDASGAATLPLAGLLSGSGNDARLAIFVRSGDDWTYQTVGVPAPAHAVGAIFTERGLYRPGEWVGIKGIFRVPRAEGLTTPAGQTVNVKVRRRNPEETLAAWTATLTPFGTLDRSLPLPKSAAVGHYSIEADLGGAIIHGGFEIQEYRPTEIAVEVNADRASYIRGDTLTCTVHGRYLHGGAMNGSGASIGVQRRDATFVPRGLEGFVIGGRSIGYHPRDVDHGSGTLDSQGRFGLHTKLEMPEQTGPETVTCNTYVEDLNREGLTASTTALVHPAEVYLGLVPAVDHEVNPGAVIRPGVVAADPAGVRRVVPVRIELFRRSIVVTADEDERAVETSLGACNVTTAYAPASCPLAIPRGPYEARDSLVVVASAKDRRGNPIASAYSLWPSERKRPPPPPPRQGPPAFEMSLDRYRFEVGEAAALRIRSPFKGPATAWVTVERESVLSRREVAIPGPEATVDVPITAAMIPNGVVAVTLIQGPEFRHDKVAFEVNPAPKGLSVSLRPTPRQAAPGDSVDIDVEVKDQKGAPARAEVTLFAADEGTLSLIRYRTPDPLAELFEHRAHRVFSTEPRDELFFPGLGRHRTRPPQIRMGATSVGAPRFDFRQTVLFEPRLVTDASGHVRHRVKLPDGLTTYRFMAVATSADDRFGSAEAHVTTSKPLMARATLPRVIRAGDRFEASVVVSTRDLPTADVELIADIQGLTQIELPRRTLVLEPGAPAEVRFPLRAERPGPVSLTFRAAARSNKGVVLARDAVALTGEIVVPIVPEAAALSGDTRGAIAEQLGDLSAVRGDYGGLELTLSRSKFAGLAAGIEQLLEYPYGCTEQTVSRMIPLLSLRDLARPLGVKLPSDLDGALAAAAQTVVANQRPDGGFGLWPESKQSEPWISAYALWGLEEANKHGVPLKAGALDHARAYLDKTLTFLDAKQASSERPTGAAELAEAAFALDVLGGAGQPARRSALFKRRDQLPLFGRALLLHALSASGADAEQIAELRREVESSLRIDGSMARAVPSGSDSYAPLLDSTVRTSALALRALVTMDPVHPLATQLALGLLADRQGGTWRTTQETAWALVALDTLRRAQPSAPPDFDARVFLGGSLLAEAGFHGESAAPSAAVKIPITRLLGGSSLPLTFAVQGTGELHYEARLRFARKVLPTEPADGGFFVQKTLRTVATAPGSRADKVRPSGVFGPGDLVLSEIVVVTPSPRHYVVIDDPLPGGFEAVHAALRGTTDDQAWLEWDFADRRELRDDRVVYFIDHLPAGIYRYRYLARATTLGTFVLPPTRVSEMYVPETFGATAAQTIRIGER